MTLRAETGDAGHNGAGSFAGQLEQLRGLISPALITDRAWEAVLDRTRVLPAAMAAFPFGFELKLHERRAKADLGVSLVGRTQLAAFFEHAGRSGGARSIARLLQEPNVAPVRRIICRSMMLEYDIGSAPAGESPDPGIFLYPAEPLVASDDADPKLRAIRAILHALTSAVGWAPEEAERELAEQVYRAQLPDTSIFSFGAFPSRERAIRLAVIGFRNAHGILAFLNRLRWPGPLAVVGSTVSRFERHGGYVGLGIQLEIHQGRLAPTLGLNFSAKDVYRPGQHAWVDRPGLWDQFFRGLHEEGLAVPEKLAALADWTCGPVTLFGAGAPRLLLRGLHHVKLVLEGTRVKQCKGYVFIVQPGAFQG